MADKILYGGDIENPIPLTLGQFASLLLETYDEKIVLVDGETREQYSASYILRHAKRIAKWMYSFGCRPGDIISIICENRVEFPIIAIAAFIGAITIAPLNPEYTPEELNHVLNLSKPKYIFSSGSNIKRIASVAKKFSFIEKIIVIGKHTSESNKIVSLDHALEQYFKTTSEEDNLVVPDFDVKEIVATVLCSSGTTGLPKGVMATQYNMMSFFSLLTQITDPDLQERFDDTTIGVVPFFHSMGFMALMLAVLSGRKLVIMKKFELRNFLQLLQDFKISILAVPPPIIALMVQSPLLKEYDLSNLREIRCGAAPLAKKFEEAVTQKLTLKPVIQAYGMTETTLGVLFTPPNKYVPGSVGTVVPGMYAKVIDENGNALGPYREGELCFKGPLIMKGYINDPVSTANTIDKDGWIHTGDVGYYNSDHFFFIVDRIKELIKYKAYQVPPAELEFILVSHPAVFDAAVIGLPDDDAGELPLGFVVLKPNAKTTEKELQDYVKEKVSPAKQLRGGIRFVESIPRNASGKILRRVLKQRAISPKSKL